MSYNQTNNQYNLEEFRRYRDGEMSFREQHDLEKSLLEDAVLAEAYEGFIAMSINEVPYDQSVSELNDKLQNRIRGGERKTLMLWVYAAAASIIVGLGIIWLVFSNNQPILKNHEIAEKIVSNLPQSDKTEEKEIEPGARSVEIRPKKNPVNSDTKQDIEIPEPSLASVEKEQKDSIQVPDLAEEESLAVAIVAKPKIETSATPSPSFNYAPSGLMQKNNNQFVTGHVEDENGEAVAGASIRLSGNKGTQTDSNGNFKLNSRVGDSLTLAMIGYKAKSIRIDANNLGDIILNSDNRSLSEVVIVDSDSKRKRSVSNGARAPAYNEPTPVEGWDSYQSYLNKMSDSSKIKGVVKVSFLVNSNGSLSEFKTSGTTELFDKAIQIVTFGPAWKPSIGNESETGKRAEVTIKFKAK